MLLALRDVGKAWHIARTGERVAALEAITLDVAPGEFLILLGPSGCGKSTLLQIMAGLEAPSSGAIDFPTAAGGHGKLTSMVFQDYALFPWRTVLANVAFGPEVRGVPRREREERARRLIELVNLRGAETRYPHELSGGMRQRVALARALANDPQVLLFDEPLAALDSQTRRVMQDELLRIWAETGKTFVYVTHSLQEAVLLGTRIVLMTAGPGRDQAGGGGHAAPAAPPHRARGGRDARSPRRAARRRGRARDGLVTASHWRRLASVVGLLLAWQILVQAGRINPLFLPAPLSVLGAMWEMTRSGELPWAVLVSLNRVVQGFIYGAVLGVLLGLLAGAIRWVEDLLDPWVAAVYPIPKSALFPLFMLWFGLGNSVQDRDHRGRRALPGAGQHHGRGARDQPGAAEGRARPGREPARRSSSR